ncbi:MAG: HEAT repeat domain-containing protein, partial [Bacteroidia bacterium]|nr:HEAT repeat domain-containing protein [Bacteroidia bacterium]
SDWMLEVVVRTLTVIEAKGLAAPVLINLYHKLSIEYESLRWAVGNAMTKVMTDSDITEVLSIVKNPDNGTSRQMFVYALAKFKKWKPTIEPVLIPLLEQDDVRGHTIYTLGHLQSQTARAKIETFVNHPITYIRKEARKALERIDKPLKK